MNKTKYMLVTSLFVIVPIFAQTSDVTNEPGYFDMGDLSSLESSTGVTEIIMEEDLLSVLATMSNEKDPNIMAILEGLKLVKANIYKVNDRNLDELKERVNEIDSRILNGDWKRIVRTRSLEEIANVYIKLNNDKKIVGLVVTSVEQDGDAAFVNIVGNIDLATIGKLGNRFHIPSLDSVHGKN
ncbi:MAG: DUF4252 domain-containing protein [Ignavibacterium sp.]|nr:MAG: DUF4252 domain-containing protein [Ignavibacterium sp.]